MGVMRVVGVLRVLSTLGSRQLAEKSMVWEEDQ